MNFIIYDLTYTFLAMWILIFGFEIQCHAFITLLPVLGSFELTHLFGYIFQVGVYVQRQVLH